MNVPQIIGVVRQMELTALGLPDMAEVIAALEVYALDCELHGRTIPDAAWKNRLPVFEAVAAFQEVCRRQRDLAEQQLRAKPPEVTFVL